MHVFAHLAHFAELQQGVDVIRVGVENSLRSNHSQFKVHLRLITTTRLTDITLGSKVSTASKNWSWVFWYSEECLKEKNWQLKVNNQRALCRDDLAMYTVVV